MHVIATAEYRIHKGNGFSIFMGLTVVENLIMKQAVNSTDWKYDETKLNSVAVYKIEVAKMTCKARK